MRLENTKPFADFVIALGCIVAVLSMIGLSAIVLGIIARVAVFVWSGV